MNKILELTLENYTKVSTNKDVLAYIKGKLEYGQKLVISLENLPVPNGEYVCSSDLGMVQRIRQ